MPPADTQQGPSPRREPHPTTSGPHPFPARHPTSRHTQQPATPPGSQPRTQNQVQQPPARHHSRNQPPDHEHPTTTPTPPAAGPAGRTGWSTTPDQPPFPTTRHRTPRHGDDRHPENPDTGRNHPPPTNRSTPPQATSRTAESTNMPPNRTLLSLSAVTGPISVGSAQQRQRGPYRTACQHAVEAGLAPAEIDEHPPAGRSGQRGVKNQGMP